jgi:hypothetical protein
MTEWKSAKQLPPVQCPVLVYTDACRICVAYYCLAGTVPMDCDCEDLANEDGENAKDGWFSVNPDRDPEDWWINETVTHWMPLPDPPKEQP